MREPIDFVITWVDGGDPAWREARAQFSGNKGEDNTECHYRDWGLLRYWFRGVENYAPWVRKIHFVTWGHLPPWLNTEHPKLHIVRHEDYIPAEFLPTFSSHVLEIYLHQIPDLAECFVYFNDDVFLIRPTKPERFFRKGKPCDMLAFQPVAANPYNPLMSHVFLNDVMVLCKYFDKRKNVLKQPLSYFHPGYPPLYFFYNLMELTFPKYTGFSAVHGTMPFRKQTFREVWEREERRLRVVASHRFRDDRDVTPNLFRNWQKLTGDFHAQNVQWDFSYFEIGSWGDERLLSTIRGQKKRVICINDAPEGKEEAPHMREELQQAFRQILPRASSFER